MKLYYRLLDLLFPRKCVLCQILLAPDQTDLCRDCRSVVPEWNRGGRVLPGIDGYASVWYYEDLVRDSLLRFKFSGKRHYARAYGRLLAMTVHKSQGSEYRALILAAWNGSPYLLSRSVLYTAVTRARELLIIVGREEVVVTMTQNGQRNRRYSGLKLRLQGKTE